MTSKAGIQAYRRGFWWFRREDDGLVAQVGYGMHEESCAPSVTCDKADLHKGIVRLDPGQIRNEKRRVWYLTEELRSILKGLLINRRLDFPYLIALVSLWSSSIFLPVAVSNWFADSWLLLRKDFRSLQVLCFCFMTKD